jgi:hypothetical protein
VQEVEFSELTIEEKIIGIMTDLMDYKKSDRGLDCLDNCMYTTEQCKHCIIGKYLNLPVDHWANLDEGITVAVLFDSQTMNRADYPEIDGVPMAVLRDIQFTHDANSYWDDEGINIEGRDSLASIYNDYMRGKYDG